MNKAFYIFLFILLFCCEAKTQTNLIYNGDFEIYTNCPINGSNPTPGGNQLINCTGWDYPTLGTSDYFNVCNNSLNGLVGVPLSQLGFQIPKNGNAYCGFAANVREYYGWYREYIQTKLPIPLIANKKYSLSFYVSLAYAEVASKNIGVYFSSNQIQSLDFKPLNVVPQIINTNGFIIDTLNWTLISGEFTAVGGEQYATIGCYSDTLNADTLALQPDSILVGYCHSYYFIDGVSLIEKTDTMLHSNCSENTPNIFTPNNDGVNDVFKLTNCIVKNIVVYNRWGNIIFNKENKSNFWDGRTTSGEECTDGAYYFVIETEEKNIKGFVQLVR